MATENVVSSRPGSSLWASWKGSVMVVLRGCRAEAVLVHTANKLDYCRHKRLLDRNIDYLTSTACRK